MDEPIEAIIRRQQAKGLKKLEDSFPAIPKEAKKALKDAVKWTAEDVVTELSGNVNPF